LNAGLKAATASEYRTGLEYKEYLQTSIQTAALPEDFDRFPYLQLLSSMTDEDESRRSTLEHIKKILESRLTQLLREIQPYAVKTRRNVYLWHPRVHACLEEELYFILIKGRNPSIDLDFLISDLRSAGVVGFSLRSVTGAWDYVVRAWLGKSQIDGGAIWQSISRNVRELTILKVTRSDLEKGGRKGGARIRPAVVESEAEMLTKIESLSGANAARDLVRDGYVLRELENSVRLFRVTLLVIVPRHLTPVAKVIGPIIRDSIERFDPHANSLCLYEVESIKDSASTSIQIIVKFFHRSFIECRRTLLHTFEELNQFGNDFSFSTLLDLDADKDVISDDGDIISRIAGVYTERAS
jgi:hypothetical protein